MKERCNVFGETIDPGLTATIWIVECQKCGWFLGQFNFCTGPQTDSRLREVLASSTLFARNCPKCGVRPDWENVELRAL